LVEDEHVVETLVAEGPDDTFDDRIRPRRTNGRRDGIFDRLDAVPWAERARLELQATGKTARRRGGPAVDELTPQEFQIAQLLADGATTHETAAKLFLSPKTVEYHLRHVYDKLGVRTRSALGHILADRVRTR